jgi:hypothetical protein
MSMGMNIGEVTMKKTMEPPIHLPGVYPDNIKISALPGSLLQYI